MTNKVCFTNISLLHIQNLFSHAVLFHALKSGNVSTKAPFSWDCVKKYGKIRQRFIQYYSSMHLIKTESAFAGVMSLINQLFIDSLAIHVDFKQGCVHMSIRSMQGLKIIHHGISVSFKAGFGH